MVQNVDIEKIKRLLKGAQEELMENSEAIPRVESFIKHLQNEKVVRLERIEVLKKEIDQYQFHLQQYNLS